MADIVEKNVIEKFLFKFVENSGDIFWIQNADYSKTLYVSPIFEKIWGLSIEEMSASKWAEHLHPEDYDRMLASVAKRNIHAKQNESFDEEYRIIRPDGEIRWIRDKSFPIFDEGKLIGFSGVAQDITERKNNEELEREKEVITKTNAFLKTAAGSLAHELKNPLSGITILTTTLETLAQKQYWRDQESSLSEEKSLALKMKAPIEMIRERLGYANDFISMQLANMGADNIDTAKFTACSISHCVQEALSSYSFEVPEHEALIHWQGGKDFNFHGDERLAKHVLWNLLSNALHYIKVEKKGEITLWLEHDADSYYLYFKDTAKGMPAEMAAKVFDQFYTKRHGGTGLGLSLCQMAMQAFGGDITCQAEEDQYAQFTLCFPREK